ncbi:hypothetical protein GALLR39Z86_05010 [Glycomyces algeriensis]|uniref:Uncharacterized protein n=1 Tax=Glycomyces algeriensis TaxID=256037 RepID=A0A9W6LFJ1_9ACTN|nr:hypothetical protein GALLR39Z86_05010 [Glycomyces algeriensis]
MHRTPMPFARNAPTNPAHPRPRNQSARTQMNPEPENPERAALAPHPHAPHLHLQRPIEPRAETTTRGQRQNQGLGPAALRARPFGAV